MFRSSPQALFLACRMALRSSALTLLSSVLCFAVLYPLFRCPVRGTFSVPWCYVFSWSWPFSIFPRSRRSTSTPASFWGVSRLASCPRRTPCAASCRASSLLLRRSLLFFFPASTSRPPIWPPRRVPRPWCRLSISVLCPSCFFPRRLSVSPADPHRDVHVIGQSFHICVYLLVPDSSCHVGRSPRHRRWNYRSI